MSWFRCESSFRAHPKPEKLARRLGISHVEALGHITALWCWICETAPDGDLSAYDADDIAIGAYWSGDSLSFLRALIDVKLIDEVDGRRIAHDWMERAQSYREAQRTRARRETKKSPKPVQDSPGRVADSPGRVEDRPRLVVVTDGRTDKTDRQTDGRTDSSESTSELLELEIELLEPPVMTFPVVGEGPKEWPLTRAQLNAWQSDFPTVDLLAEARKAHAWVEANPGRRKTSKGMTRFLVGWFTRVTDRRQWSPRLGREERINAAFDEWNALQDEREAR